MTKSPPAAMQDYDLIEGDNWSDVQINGVPVGDEYLPKDDDGPTEGFLERERCPYCREPTLGARSNRNHRNGDESYWDLIHCQNCAFWQFAHEFLKLSGPGSGLEWCVYSSKAREFEVDLPDGTASELAVQFRRNPVRWSHIDPTSLEKLVAALFRLNYQDCEVMHVGRPGDGGVDVLFIDSSKKSWLVQVKRRRNGGAEDINTLRNLLGVMLLKDVPRGIVVSTADYYSYHSRRESQLAAQRGYQIELIDRGKINRMLDPAIPKRPWRTPHGPLSCDAPKDILRLLEQQFNARSNSTHNNDA